MSRQGRRAATPTCCTKITCRGELAWIGRLQAPCCSTPTSPRAIRPDHSRPLRGCISHPTFRSARNQFSPTKTASRPGCSIARCSRSEEHTSELQSLMRISSAVFCFTKKKTHKKTNEHLYYIALK